MIRQENRAVTDMYWSPPLSFDELHMVVETRGISLHRLETRLLHGDVRRYAHVWHLTPLAGQRCTRAVHELTMRRKTWVTNWFSLGSCSQNWMDTGNESPPKRPAERAMGSPAPLPNRRMLHPVD